MTKIENLAIVDDDRLYVRLMKSMFSEIDAVNCVNNFENGLDAINYLKMNAGQPNNLPQVILLDLFMPVMDGWQFLDEFQKINPSINQKIIIYIISSSISLSDLEKAKQLETVTDYLLKPITIPSLLGIVKNITTRLHS